MKKLLCAVLRFVRWIARLARPRTKPTLKPPVGRVLRGGRKVDTVGAARQALNDDVAIDALEAILHVNRCRRQLARGDQRLNDILSAVEATYLNEMRRIWRNEGPTNHG